MPFGRGGAGNRTSSRPLPPSELTTTTNDTHSRHSSDSSKDHGMPNYSTGRGGVGNMHGAGEERRMFSFDEELAKEGKVGAVPVYHVGRGGAGNAVDEARRDSAGSAGSRGSGVSGMRGGLDWIRGFGKKD
ncbi:MAG: hypothetical protein ASARMPREDX12_005350 [Alectoria sarmentosa]|nr:MAG: hypothetical protein ASARMPREDX12_005350 [Alectoria sarmentosa]